MASKVIDPGRGKTIAPQGKNDVFEFVKDNLLEVKVKVARGKKAVAKEFPTVLPADRKDFILDRLVINLEVPENQGNPIDMEIRKQGNETKLAYVENGTWKLIHNVTAQGGYLKATVPNWPDDPAIGIGH
jgi:hypothetical protein